ncbi:tubulin/FtsZ family protein, partial [Striga asiatica]
SELYSTASEPIDNSIIYIGDQNQAKSRINNNEYLRYLKKLCPSLKLRLLRGSDCVGMLINISRKRKAPDDNLSFLLHFPIKPYRVGHGHTSRNRGGGIEPFVIGNYCIDKLLHASIKKTNAHDELALVRTISIRVVKGLDESIWRKGHGHEPVCQPPDPLMMIAVDPYLLLHPEPSMEWGAGDEAYRVPVGVVVLVVDVGHTSSRQLLELGASADAQVRDVTLEAELREGELYGILLAVECSVGGVDETDLVQLLRREGMGISISILGRIIMIIIIEGWVNVLSLAQEDSVNGAEARLLQRGAISPTDLMMILILKHHPYISCLA